MVSEKKIEIINKLIDDQAKVLVGILLKRLDILSQEKIFNSNLYKSLVKEHIYEQARNLKTLIKIGQLTFESKEKE